MKKNSKKIVSGPNDNQSIAHEIMNRIARKDKSVRSTFTLTEASNDALSKLVDEHDFNIKFTIDTICEDFSREPGEQKLPSILSQVVDYLRENREEYKGTVRRTMVLSQKSLSLLNQLSKENAISRDAILNRALAVLYLLMTKFGEVRIEAHKRALVKINQLWKQANEVEEELKKVLLDDDPVLDGLGYAITHLMRTSSAIEKELKDGTAINPEEI